MLSVVELGDLIHEAMTVYVPATQVVRTASSLEMVALAMYLAIQLHPEIEDCLTNKERPEG